jgi:hypothetical protein
MEGHEIWKNLVLIGNSGPIGDGRVYPSRYETLKTWD